MGLTRVFVWLLAASGALAAGGLSGCLGRVASATTNIGASPAAYYDGDPTRASAAGVRVYGANETDVRYVPATVRSGSGRLSSEVGLEGWSTTSATKAQDYNSSRSNKPRTAWWDGAGEDDGDGDDGDDSNHGAHATTLEEVRDIVGGDISRLEEARANDDNTRSDSSTIRAPDWTRRRGRRR